MKKTARWPNLEAEILMKILKQCLKKNDGEFLLAWIRNVKEASKEKLLEFKFDQLLWS